MPTIDPLVPNEEIEWLTKCRSAVIVTAILMAEVDADGTIYNSIKKHTA